MIVSTDDFFDVLARLMPKARLALDTETTGLRPYHGDRLFSLIISDGEESFYFNFQDYIGIPESQILGRKGLGLLSPLWDDREKLWYMHNAKFDLAMLAREGIHLAGEIHCTKIQERVLHNDFLEYSLDACAKRIGLEKSDAVEKYIKDHKLWKWVDIPGKQVRHKDKFYDQVPFNIISSYGERDAEITFALGKSQEAALEALTSEHCSEKVPALSNVAANERRLSKTIHRMEQTGLKIDRPYCVRAASYETARAAQAAAEFEKLTGRPYQASPKLFAEVFADQRELWKFTENNNPSFTSDVIKRFSGPVVAAVLTLRDAKAKADFYHGFLYHADANDIIHPGMDSGGTATGRFSSYDPNFQNLTDEENSDAEFLVRRAIVPRPGHVFFMPDFEQMEYKMMLEYAARLEGHETELIRQVKMGKDVHQATADLVLQVSGLDIGRSKAKNGNFAKLYGAGLSRLAETLKCDRAGAQAVNDAIDTAAPEIANFCQTVVSNAEIRPIMNWFGRRYEFKNSRFAYKAPNYLIQGGCADVVKVAMNRIDDALAPYKSKMLLQVHDELIIEIPEQEISVVPKIVTAIMEGVFPARYLPMTTSAEFSWKSMQDKSKGYP